MNYLAHHFFYQLEDAYHNTGLLLPDLSRAARGRRALILTDSWQGVELALVQGCAAHYEADDWFHQSAYFKTVSQVISNQLSLYKTSTEGFMKQRTWFLGHILAEMLLDRIIIDKYPEALEHLYSDLNKIEVEVLVAYLLKAGKHDIGRFPEAFTAFRSSEFLKYYAKAEGLIGSLSRVLVRTGQAVLTDNETRILIRHFDKWLQVAYETKKPHQMARL